MVKLSAKNRKIKHFTLRQSNQDDQPNAWPSTFSHFVCHVVFDSQVHAPFVGLRAVGSLGRRVRFEAEDCEIDLGITPDPATLRLYLEGQITPSAGDASGGWLRLSKAYDQWLLHLDETGEFRLDGLPPGTYRFEFTFKDRMIEVPVLQL